MTPKEKAEDFVNKMQDKYYRIPSLANINYKQAKQCAIIAVNEILNINSVDKDYELSNYWNEVLEEINKL